MVGRDQRIVSGGWPRIADRHRCDGDRRVFVSDPAPSLGDFQADVTNHQIGYYTVSDPTHGFGRGRQHLDITPLGGIDVPAIASAACAAPAYPATRPTTADGENAWSIHHACGVSAIASSWGLGGSALRAARMTAEFGST
jgi:hypothetical protein